jgi:acetolactate synthase-1/2/3 large subunit
MKVSDYIVDFFIKHDVDVIFGHLGGFNADIIDSMYCKQYPKFVLNYHEQASAFAANGYAWVRDAVGIAIATGAPSSCNLVPGIANSYFDSVPCVFIVGSVHSLSTRVSKSIRQNAFEEIDMVHMVSDITKYATRIVDPNDIRFELEKAFHIAKEGRKGPVLLDIPYNISRSDIIPEELRGYESNSVVYDDYPMLEIMNLLHHAKRPVMLLGGGTKSNLCRNLIKKLLTKVQIPTLVSLCGLDVLAHDHKSYVGFIGHYGNRYANLALAKCDFVLILGSRLDERQLGGWQSKLLPEAKVIRIDIDKIELGRKIPETISIHSSVECFLKQFLMEDFQELDFSQWQNVIAGWKKRYPSYDLSSKDVEANNFLRKISDYLPDNAVICSDVGQNQMSVAQAINLTKEQRLINCGGYGSMGFSLPAAIGAAYAYPGTAIFSINGDGGIQMNIQELQTLKRDNLPVNVIIMNNYCLGMIRKLQENMYDNRNAASVEGYSAPDFSAIANAYGIQYLKIDSVQKYELIENFISDKEPRVIEVILPVKMQNNPEPGKILDKQLPLLSHDEINLIEMECVF